MRPLLQVAAFVSAVVLGAFAVDAANQQLILRAWVLLALAINNTLLGLSWIKERSDGT